MSDQSVFIFFTLSNLQIDFVVLSENLTQIDRNVVVVKNSHWPTLAVSSSSRKRYSSLSFYWGLAVIEISLMGISIFVAEKLDNA